MSMQQPKTDHNLLLNYGAIKLEHMDLLDLHHPPPAMALGGAAGVSGLPSVGLPPASVAQVAQIPPLAPMNGSTQNHHHSSHLRPSYRHSGSFTGLAFHNPFDMNSYPITNPPILDSTVLPYGDLGTQRRRISISNGQIGQIVNHEAIFLDEDLLDDLNDLSPYAGNLNGPNSGGVPDQRIMPFDVEGSHSQTHSAQLQPYGQIPAPPLGPVVTAHQGHQHVGHRQFQENGHLSNLATPGPSSGPTDVISQTSQDMAGVPPPNHQLIYNNEVIYNPNNGPIPGTAAWKKERLLERNRIAASKCRQRKKHAQQQLQDNMDKSQKKIKDQTERLQKYEKLFSIYNAALVQHFQTGSDISLEPLRGLVTLRIDDISLTSLEK